MRKSAILGVNITLDNSEQFDIDELLRSLDLGEEEPTEQKQEPEAEEDDIEIEKEVIPPQDEYGRVIMPDPEEQAAKPKKEKTSWQKNFLLYLHDFVYLVAILILISPMFFRIVMVSGTSMVHTLLDGDYLLVLSNTFYREPEAGDIVVISKESFDDGKPIVKRVIATEGQWVDIDFEAGIVYVDGVALDEPYTYSATTTQEGVSFPLQVEEGCIFVLGDNREISRDSRYPAIGQIAKEEVLGKVIFLFIPGTNGQDVFGNAHEPRDWTRVGVIG